MLQIARLVMCRVHFYNNVSSKCLVLQSSLCVVLFLRLIKLPLAGFKFSRPISSMLWVLCTYFSSGILKDYSSYIYQGSWVFAVSLCRGKMLQPAFQQPRMRHQSGIRNAVHQSKCGGPFLSDSLFCHIQMTHYQHSVHQCKWIFKILKSPIPHRTDASTGTYSKWGAGRSCGMLGYSFALVFVMTRFRDPVSSLSVS